MNYSQSEYKISLVTFTFHLKRALGIFGILRYFLLPPHFFDCSPFYAIVAASLVTENNLPTLFVVKLIYSYLAIDSCLSI